MGKVEPAERYTVTIDLTVRTRDQLFSRTTDTIYLGYSSFNGWDQFGDMFQGRLDGDILVEISHEDLSGLPERDRAIYLEILTQAAQDYPDKLRVI